MGLQDFKFTRHVRKELTSRIEMNLRLKLGPVQAACFACTGLNIYNNRRPVTRCETGPGQVAWLTFFHNFFMIFYTYMGSSNFEVQSGLYFEK